MGLFGGTKSKTNMEEFSAECHSVDSSGDSKVLTELQIAIRSKLLFYTIKSQENWEEFERQDVFRCLFIWCCKYIYVNADMAKEQIVQK